MAAKRGAAPLFDRGFRDIDELKSRCKAETGLEPPAGAAVPGPHRAQKRAARRRGGARLKRTMQVHGRGSVRAVDRAYDAVRSGIIAGRYLAGARLTEQEIATTVGVSRTPVREALRRLDAEGLVEFTPNLGAIVTVWSDADSDEVFDLRAMLESYSARRATLRASDETGRGAARPRREPSTASPSSASPATSSASRTSTAGSTAGSRKLPPVRACRAHSPR